MGTFIPQVDVIKTEFYYALVKALKTYNTIAMPGEIHLNQDWGKLSEMIDQ